MSPLQTQFPIGFFKPALALPSAPTMLTPADASSTTDDTPTFTWENPAGGAQVDSYTWEMASDSSFTEIVESATGLTSPTHTASQTLNGETYYWRVRGRNAKGDGTWSTTRSIILTPYFLDNFTDTDGTAITSHTPDTGGSWSSILSGSSIVVASNQVHSTVAGTRVSNNSGFTDYKLSADITFGIAGDYCRFLVRFVDGSNYYYMNISSDRTSNNDWFFGFRNGGSETGISAGQLNLVASSTHHVDVLVEGTTFTWYMDDSVFLTYTEASLHTTSTKFGIGFTISGGGDPKIDTVKVTNPFLSGDSYQGPDWYVEAP